MNYRHWIVAKSRFLPGMWECCPLETNEKGAVTSVLLGLTVITTLDDLLGKGALTISEVDDIENPTTIRQVAGKGTAIWTQ